MNKLQIAIVIALSLTAVVRVVMFDTRGKKHKPVSALIAFGMVVWLGGLCIAATFGLQSVVVWGLIFGLALHTGAIVWARGNVNKIHPRAEI